MAWFHQTADQLLHLLSADDHATIESIEEEYRRFFPLFERYAAGQHVDQELIQGFDALGKKMKSALSGESRIHVYGFETPSLVHAEASRLIARLRDRRTQRPEFVYLIQRAYEMLFHFGYNLRRHQDKSCFLVETPVDQPVRNWAVHKVSDLDSELGQSAVCVLLRGALLPSIIMSKEIQEHTTSHYITPFALFRAKRNETRSKQDMQYLLDLDRSYFKPEDLHDKDLIFADPMNATGGSMITVVEYLRSLGIRFRRILSFHTITSFKGALQTVRGIPEAELFTLWLDPFLNDSAYILPGLGDAGDRLNGRDGEAPRNILQLLAGFGPATMDLYRDQVAAVEKAVLG